MSGFSLVDINYEGQKRLSHGNAKISEMDNGFISVLIFSLMKSCLATSEGGATL